MASGPGVPVMEEWLGASAASRRLLRHWRPPGMRAVLATVHGSGADGARFAGLADVLATQRIATCAIDLRGCGRSSGAPRRAAHLADLDAMMATLRRRNPGLPVFMLGHGPGASLACHYALRRAGRPDGIVCEAIALAWCGGSVMGGLATALSRFGRRLHEPLARLQAPLLLLHGAADPMAPLSASEYLHRCVASCDRTLQVFEGHGHDLLNGPGHALVRDKVCRWVQARLDPRHRHPGIGIEYINE